MLTTSNMDIYNTNTVICSIALHSFPVRIQETNTIHSGMYCVLLDFVYRSPTAVLIRLHYIASAVHSGNISTGKQNHVAVSNVQHSKCHNFIVDNDESNIHILCTLRLVPGWMASKIEQKSYSEQSKCHMKFVSSILRQM